MIHYIMRYLLVVLLLTSSLIFANEKEARACADIDDPTLRLSCYDSLFRMQPIEDPKLTMPEKKQETMIITFHLTNKYTATLLPRKNMLILLDCYL